MSKEITKQQVCVLIRSGLELWIDADRTEDLEKAISDQSRRFVKISGQLINPFEILGIFTPDAMEDRQRRKNGQWKCLKATWHDKGQVCECRDYKETVTAYVEGYGEITYKR
jgi:hypothetical protein